MSEYWVSQAKKHCDFCKCWIADNKPSREFHERGKRHQDNVKKKIEEVRKKSVLKAQKDQEMSDSLREMEENALRALKRDLVKNPAMAVQYGVKLKPKDPPKQYGPEPRPESSKAAEEEEEEEEEGEEKEEDDDDDEEEDPNADNAEEGKEKDEEPAATTMGTWHMATSEQGYPYYWNDITSEVSWVPPSAYLAQEEAASSTSTGRDGVEDEDDEKSSTSSDEKPSTSSDEKPSEKPQDPVLEMSTHEEVAPKKPIHQDPVKRPKRPQPKIYKLEHVPKKSKIEVPLLPADIPLPGDIPLPQPPRTEVAESEENAQNEEESDEENLPDESRQAKVSHHSNSHVAYGTWAQVEEQQPEAVDLGLPEVADRGEPFITVPVAEPRFKIREKTVSSIGSGPVFFKKPKKKITAAQFLKKREET